MDPSTRTSVIVLDPRPEGPLVRGGHSGGGGESSYLPKALEWVHRVSHRAEEPATSKELYLGRHPSDGMIAKNPQKHPTQRDSPESVTPAHQNIISARENFPLLSPHFVPSSWTLERVRTAEWTLTYKQLA